VTIRRQVELTIDGLAVTVPEGSTILEACRSVGTEVPTLCYLETLAPVNVCRVCVVEVAGSRTLVPACSRPVSGGMEVQTDSERVRTSRRMVLELLASSVDLSTAGDDVQRWIETYGARPARHGPLAPPTERDQARAGEHEPVSASVAATVAQAVKRDNDQYVRDYSKCILCYKCVEACGEEAQHTFAIAVAGRGFDARISTEMDVPLPGSACVYCGNCIAVCPTGALMFVTEHDLRARGEWDEERQQVTRTVCPYCGVGCNLDVHVQDGRIVKVSSPLDHDVTRGNLCVKGRFGFEFAQAFDDGG
jgi:predicted molibdopterin-dependent oxidoreductase YjgC